MIEHCVSWLKKDSEEKAFKAYITDALQGITNNTARIVNKDGMMIMPKRFTDVISNKEDNSTDVDAEQKSQEIKDHMKNILAKLGKEDG